jgi:hypothetical protein
MTVHCAKCAAEWDLGLRLPMEIDLAVKAMRRVVSVGCPKCGAKGKSVICGSAPTDAAKP